MTRPAPLSVLAPLVAGASPATAHHEVIMVTATLPLMPWIAVTVSGVAYGLWRKLLRK